MNVRKPLTSIHRALAYMQHELAGKRYGWPERLKYGEDSVDIHCFEQTWGDTSCGHEGMAGQAVTVADTVVLVLRDGGSFGGPAAVFHGSRLAYLVDKPNDEFWSQLQTHRLRAAMDYDGEYEAK